MNEKKYQKRFEIQQKMISRQSEQIEDLKSQVRRLQLEIEEKNKVIDSIEPMRKELAHNIAITKQYKNEFKSLIEEVRIMKNIINQEVYKGRWKIIKLLSP